MGNRDKLIRGACLSVIAFLSIYCGCLLFSRYTGVEIPWAQWLQRQVVQGCLTVGQPVLGETQGETAGTLSWQDGALEFVGAILDWPVVLEAQDNHGTKDDTGDSLTGAGNDTTREQDETSRETDGGDAKEQNSENKSGDNESELNLNNEKNGENITNNHTADSQNGAENQEPRTEASETAAVESTTAEATAVAAVPVQSALLPIGSDIRPEISQLPAIAGLDASQMLDFNYLLQKCYVVNSGCSVTEEILDPRTLLSKNLTITHEGEGYEILIYHTHSQEAFADSAAGDVSQTVIGLGDYLTTLLQEKGYRVLHHTGIYDMENGVLERDYAYDRALPVLEQILAENPSIQVVIDLHRDGVAEDVHLVTDVNGEQTARIMFFNGMCRNEAGERTDVTNPYREDNLAFSLQSALQLEAHYPGMLRVVYLKQSRYNQHLRSRSMLVEVGAQTNTVAEVYRAIPVLADVLGKVLQ